MTVDEEILDGAIDNLTPAAVYAGKSKEVLSKREQIKQNTMTDRRKLNLQVSPISL